MAEDVELSIVESRSATQEIEQRPLSPEELATLLC